MKFVATALKNISKSVRIRILRRRAAKLPSLPLEGKVLIIAPHPDDEVMGCGGLIARLCSEGHAPDIVILTGGEASHRGCCDADSDSIIAHRHELTLRAAKILGLPEDKIHCLDFRDGNISEDMATDKAVKLTELICESRPSALFVPHWGEGWPDHVNAARMVRNLASEGIAIYEYCVWLWYYNIWGLDWRNGYQYRMSPVEHSCKLDAIEAYVQPCAPCGLPWSGVLPRLFVDANKWNRELYFKAP